MPARESITTSIATLATVNERTLAASSQGIQTKVVTCMSISSRYRVIFAAMGLLFAGFGLPSRAKDQSTAPAAQAAAKPDAKSESAPATAETPAQIELLETKIRFEANGDSRKEVHTRVHINSELGVRQFSRLNFNFNRAYEKIEIPLVHITHKSGGSADILPSAITDEPNPAAADFPAYHDVRVKSIRILGLEPADILEYRVITTTTKGPLAPDFWLDHNFDRTGVVTKEIFEIDLPAQRFASHQGSTTGVGQIRVSKETPEASKTPTGTGDDARLVYRWNISSADLPKSANDPASGDSDVVLTTFASWDQLQQRLQSTLQPHASAELSSQVAAAMKNTSRDPIAPETAYYNFVATKIRTVDLPLDLGRFGKRHYSEVLSSGVASPEDKISLYTALTSRTKPVKTLLVTTADAPEKQLPRPSLFAQILVALDEGKRTIYLDPDLEVAPWGVIRPDLRGKKALELGSNCTGESCWMKISGELPFSSTQRVSVDATIAPDGTLDAKVKYTMRGDNELLLRMAFHQSPRDKWKEVAQLMSLSDGFRGKILSTSASDPYATKNAFTVEYEISQPKFVDWSKKPVRIPAPLPVLSVPDLPGKTQVADKSSTIDLGTPLDVETRVTLHLPAGTSVEVPTGTIVDRDYATFVSRYSTDAGTVTAIRHINFIHRQVAASRVPDYAAFLHAVQTDQAQLFTLTRADGASTTAASTQQKP